MKEAMVACALGDDGYGDDPTVNHMQEEYAKFFGKEDALYFPSGTQSNLAGIMTNCKKKGDSVILGDKCHIYNLERGGISAIGNVLPQVIPNKSDGTFDL